MADTGNSTDTPESKPAEADSDEASTDGIDISEADSQELLQQYIHYGEVAIETSNQRIQTNRTFGIILTTVLAGIVGFARGDVTLTVSLAVASASGIGLISCIYWHRSIQSYRRLNGARYKILNEIEEELPVKPYSDEWRYLERQNPDPEMIEPRESNEKHTTHTVVESRYVLLLGAGYAIVLLYGLILTGCLLL